MAFGLGQSSGPSCLAFAIDPLGRLCHTSRLCHFAPSPAEATGLTLARWHLCGRPLASSSPRPAQVPGMWNRLCLREEKLQSHIAKGHGSEGDKGGCFCK